jgi:predicted GIY-YIG superfamily endonuclease
MKSQHYSQRAVSRPLRNFEASSCRIYVIELDPTVASDPVFARANPHRQPRQPCVYVGMTSLDVEERFHQHRTGVKNASRIAGFGQRLRMDLVPFAKPTRRTWAMAREKRLARELRSKGFGVWQA